MKLLLRSVLLVVLFLVVSSDVFAATGINRKINFQGKVVNKGVGSTDGTNVVDGNYNFTFSMWSVLSAGTSIWSEVWSGGSQVPVVSGIFQVALGTNATFPPSVNFGDDSLYISVNFNGDGDMTPRIRMTAVPYAFNAEKVSGLTIIGTGVTLNQSLQTTDSPTFVTAKFTNVTIGSGTTILYIDSSGNLVQGTLPAGGSSTGINGLNSSGGNIGLGGTLANLTKIDLNSNNIGFFGTGNFGIGTTSPQSLLDVNGVARISNPADASVFTQLGSNYIRSNGIQNFFFDQNGVGVDMLFRVSNAIALDTTAMVIKKSGNVGIGTTNPLYKLEVVGDALISARLGIGATNVNFALNVGTSAVNFGGNLTVGGTLTFSGVSVGTGTTVLYIGAGGVLVQGTLPAGGSSTGINGLNSSGGNIGLGGTLANLTKIDLNSNNIGFFGTGNFGIGTTTPSYKLELVGSNYLFRIGDTGGSDLVTITETNNQFNIPTTFSSSGDVSLANDLTFTNSVISTIRSSAPFSFESGEVFNSSNLTLKTYNFGNIILDSGTSGAVLPASNLLTDLGSSTNRFNNTWTSRLNVGSLVSADANYALHVGTSAVGFDGNLAVGGTLTFSGVPIGIGTTVLYIGAGGVLVQGTLPAGGSSTGINGLNSSGSNIGLGGTLTSADYTNINIGSGSSGFSILGINNNTQSFAVRANGNVGIGTTNPLARLHIEGVGLSGLVFIKNLQTGHTAAALTIQNTSTSIGITGGEFIRFLNSSGAKTGRIRTNVLASSVAYSTSSVADFAEYVIANEPTEAGDLIAFSNNKFIKAIVGDKLAGIHSSYASFVGGEAIMDEPNAFPMAMAGIVKLKVSSANGAINPGDPLTSGNIRGVAVKATTAGNIAAKAIGSYDNSDPNQIGMIEVIANLGWYEPGLDVNQQYKFENLVTTVNNFDIDKITPLANGLEILTKRIDDLEKRVNDLTGVVAGIATKSAVAEMPVISEFLNKIFFRDEVLFEKKVTFNSEMAGYAIVNSGDDRVEVIFENEYSETPVINITMLVDIDKEIETVGQNYMYFVTKKDNKGFTIVLNKKTTSDVKFSWSAISIKDPKIYRKEIILVDPIMVNVGETIQLSLDASPSAVATDSATIGL